VADFGCGPQGGLCWAVGARARIGIDVLANAYNRFNIAAQNMVYVCSTESSIPLPSNYLSVLFTRNAMDHVDNFPAMCAEVLRVLAPGGVFVDAFNLNQPQTVCEPQTLTLEYINENLLRHLKVVHQRVAPMGPDENKDLYFYQEPPAIASPYRILWVRPIRSREIPFRRPNGHRCDATAMPQRLPCKPERLTGRGLPFPFHFPFPFPRFFGASVGTSAAGNSSRAMRRSAWARGSPFIIRHHLSGAASLAAPVRLAFFQLRDDG
jgi:hypothetical protein